MPLLLRGAGRGKVIGGGSWATVYTTAPTSTANDAGWNGYTMVGRIAVSQFSATGGTTLRVYFNGPLGAENMTVAAFYIGNGGGSDVYDFKNSTPGDGATQVSVGGVNAFTIANAAADVVSDDITFVKDATNDFLYSAHFTNAAADDMWKCGVADTTPFGTWYKTPAAESGTADKTGYSNAGAAALNMISKIEIFS